MYTIDDCTDENILHTNIEGRYIILDSQELNDVFKKEVFQLVLAYGGSGCIASNLGNYIYVKDPISLETFRLIRGKHRSEERRVGKEGGSTCTTQVTRVTEKDNREKNGRQGEVRS